MSSLEQLAGRTVPEDLERPVLALCRVAAGLASRISLGALNSDLGATVGANTGGDQQKALDVIADDEFSDALKGTGIRWYASEEQDQAVLLDPDGPFAIAIDPLDGSSNIDTNVSIGTIFSIQPALDDADASFLRDGRGIRAAGYFIYGPQTMLIISFGNGVRRFVLDRDAGLFRETAEASAIPPCAREFAINASNYRHWPRPIRAYIDDCVAGMDGTFSENFNMRWIASLVAETHRILIRGGIFLYPGDARDGYQQGRLRLVYECAPIAFLVEQAGGRATDGARAILDRVPDSLHARTPFVFGSAEKVDHVAAYHERPETEVAALFGNRGLFRA